MNICVYGAASVKISMNYIRPTEQLGEFLASRGHSLVYGGGASGLMGAIARGFTKGGAQITGVAPSFFNADGVLYDKCSEFIYTDTMRERKKIMEEKSDAFVVTPGGVGTFDEFFEILTLKQLGRHSKPIALYNVNGYFDELELLMKKAVREDIMSEKSMDLYGVFDKCDELASYIESINCGLHDITEVRFIK